MKNERIIFGHLFWDIPLASLSLKMPSSGNLFRWKKVSFAFVVYFLSQYWATVHLELSSSRKEFTLIFLPLKGKKNEWKKWAVQFSFPKYIFSHLALLSYYFCGYISTRPLWPEGKNYWASWRQKVLHVFTSRLFQNQNYLTGISFCSTLFYQRKRERNVSQFRKILSRILLQMLQSKFFCSQVSTFYRRNLTKKMVKSVR